MNLSPTSAYLLLYTLPFPPLNRMKREVASSVVERGVAERVRLKQTFEKRTDELQKQHDAVRNALADHRSKVGDNPLLTLADKPGSRNIPKLTYSHLSDLSALRVD